MATSSRLINFARGGKGFHAHRLEIVRAFLQSVVKPVELSPYLRDQLFALEDGWRAFAFSSRDWELAARLLTAERVDIEQNMLRLAVAYVESNRDSVAKLYAMSDTISGRILREEAIDLAPGTDQFSPTEAQSIFGLRVLGATHSASSQTMRLEMENILSRGSWCQSRLMFPLINMIANRESHENLDNFLAYFAVGCEHPAEMLAIKLLLSDVAARSASLSFKTYVGLVGHPYDMCEFILDHVEFRLARGEPIASHLRVTVSAFAELLPQSRVERIAALIEAFPDFNQNGPDEARVGAALAAYGVEGASAATGLTRFGGLAPVPHEHVASTARPLTILFNMRASEYPEPEQFQNIVAERAVWSFVDGGRIIGALLRSIYMVDRTESDLEARDVLRLVAFYGCVTPFLASCPSAIVLFRRLAGAGALDGARCLQIQERTNEAIKGASPLKQRLWINELQWRLRTLQEEGRVHEWLTLVRNDAVLRPLYLTGIDWPWVEEIIHAQRLRPFRSFDGAYLLLLMEMETSSDPLRLKLVLDRLLEGKGFDEVVSTILTEFGEVAPAFLRKYLTVANLLSSGLAANHFAALDQRIEALEEGILTLGFGPLLTKEMYESEAKLLTGELLLKNVDAGQFEVPWEFFQKEAVDHQRDLYDTFVNLRLDEDEESLASLVATPKLFKNGRKEEYRYRRNNTLLYQLIVQIIEGFLQHPAFGLEVILSGRFRHNRVLEQLQAAMAVVEAANIPPVTSNNKQRLIGDYRPVMEQTLYDWCTSRLHTQSPSKPNGLFDLVPTVAEMSDLIDKGSGLQSLPDLVRAVVEWLKSKLRLQVAEASNVFVHDLKRLLTVAFNRVRDEQVAAAGNLYRPEDARRIHTAVLDAILRRVEALAAWFDGVDTVSASRLTLAQLCHATESLFEHMAPTRKLVPKPDEEAGTILFEPSEVKIAFDLVREIAFNALKHSPPGEVALTIKRLPGDGPVIYVFSNVVETECVPSSGAVVGKRYESTDEALTREGNSGRYKVAASAATLAGEEARITWDCQDEVYSLTVPLRPTYATVA